MRPVDVSACLTALLPKKQPMYLWGPPGVGKSSVVKQAAAANDLQVCDIRAVLLDPVDLRGLPKIGDGVAEWVPPAFLPREGNGVLFLDELAQAPPLVQAACLQLTLDRRVGEYVLPAGWTVVAASNRQEDRAGAHKLISPLLNRFLHLDMEVSNDDWSAWAIHAGIAPEVRAFMNWRPALLFDFDPSIGARAFPTPRSWEFVSTVLPATPTNLLHPVVAGCVGDGPAAEFVAFVRTYRDLPDVDALLKNPSSMKTVPTDPAIVYALCGAVAERARKGDAKLLANVFEVANKLPDEFNILMVRDSAALSSEKGKGCRMLDTRTVPAAAAWLKKHRDTIAPDFLRG